LGSATEDVRREFFVAIESRTSRFVNEENAIEYAMFSHQVFGWGSGFAILGFVHGSIFGAFSSSFLTIQKSASLLRRIDWVCDRGNRNFLP
jgi:hypothetical protein